MKTSPRQAGTAPFRSGVEPRLGVFGLGGYISELSVLGSKDSDELSSGKSLTLVEPSLSLCGISFTWNNH